MNTYACWLYGRPGYCFEHPRSGWWFVPEQGQPDNEVRRGLDLDDFVFANRFEQQMEHHRKRMRSAIPTWRRWLRSLFAPARAQSVAGLLLLPAEI